MIGKLPTTLVLALVTGARNRRRRGRRLGGAVRGEARRHATRPTGEENDTILYPTLLTQVTSFALTTDGALLLQWTDPQGTPFELVHARVR